MKKILLICCLLVVFFLSTQTAFAPPFPYEDYGCRCHNTLYTSRVGGDDRIDTSVEISKHLYEDGVFQMVDCEVVIARSDDFPDALSAAALAGLFDCPILLNPSDELDDRVKDELERLWNGFDNVNDGFGDEPDVVYLMGGEGALSDDIKDELEDLGFDVKRLGGADRYETAAIVADELEDEMEDAQNIFICTGENWPDAVAASAWSCVWTRESSDPWPVLLVKKDEIPGATLDWLLSHKDVNAYVIGGTGVISSEVMEKLGYYLNGDIERVAGENRYETCVAIAEHPDLWHIDRSEGPNVQNFTFVTGANFPDALSACTVAMKNGAPIIMTSSLDEAVVDYFDELFDGATPHEPTHMIKTLGTSGHGIVIGKTGAVSKATEDEIADALSDGDFEPTTVEPAINSFDVTIDPDNDLPDVAQYDSNDEIVFDVETDERIWSEDGTIRGSAVVIEDISELGGNTEPYNQEDVPLDIISGDSDSDNFFELVVDVKKKSTSPEQREVTFVARATNQAGSDTMESDSIEIYN